MQNSCLHSKNLKLYKKKNRKDLTLQNQPFTDVSKISVFKNLGKFTKNTNILEPLFNKVTELQPGYLLKKRPRHRCFPVSFAKLLRTPFL